ncbi:MAG: sodium:solute symporter [Mangrovibacterium sp.]
MVLQILMLYLIVLFVITYISTKQLKTPSDFFAAGKNKGVLLVMGSLLASVLGGSAILGSVNLAMTQGWASAWYLLAAAIGFFCLLPVVDKVVVHGKYTLSDLIGNFYGTSARKLAAIIIPLAWTGIVAAQVIAAAKILFSLFGLPYDVGVILSSLVFVCYTVLGGQLSILKTDLIQSIIIVLGILLSAVYLFFHHAEATVSPIADSFPFNAAFEPMDLLVLLLSFSTTFVVGPDVYSRIFCARNAQVAKRSVLLSAVVLVPFAFVLAYLGVFAVENLDANQLHSVALIEVIEAYLPPWVVGIMAAALLSAVLSSADTTLLTASMMLSELFYRDINNKKSLQLTKVFVVLIGMASLVIALYATSIVNTLLLALSFYSGAFIVPIILALWGVKVNKKNATTAMLVGGLMVLGGKLLATYLHFSLGNYILIVAFAVNYIILKIYSK